MNDKRDDLSDELLNAYLDDELDADERGAVLERLLSNREIAERACELRRVKDLTQHAYLAVVPPSHQDKRRAGPWYLSGALAASLILACGMLIGWFAHGRLAPAEPMASIFAPAASGIARLAAQHGDVRRIILHLSSNQPEEVDAALDEAEDLVSTYQRMRQKVKLEFIANSDGLDILRSDTSTHRARIEALLKKYPEISFLACRQTINHLKEKGVKVKLLPHTEVVPSALGQIIERLQEGWIYIKV
jgi:intracellular sulfur oxidation DsrE/DsrF family protein